MASAAAPAEQGSCIRNPDRPKGKRPLGDMSVFGPTPNGNLPRVFAGMSATLRGCRRPARSSDLTGRAHRKVRSAREPFGAPMSTGTGVPDRFRAGRTPSGLRSWRRRCVLGRILPTGSSDHVGKLHKASILPLGASCEGFTLRGIAWYGCEGRPRVPFAAISPCETLEATLRGSNRGSRVFGRGIVGNVRPWTDIPWHPSHLSRNR